MARLNFGFHEGPTGHGVPDEFFSTLDAAGIPFVAKATDHLVLRAQEIAQASSLPHVCVFRRSVGLHGTHVYDVPNYNLSPAAAAAQHWNLHQAEFPPQLNRQVTWVETINEVDKNRAEWLAEFSTETALNYALPGGYRYAAFGWSPGEPEPDHWRGPKMREFLQLASQYPDRLAISLHEYSLSTENIWNGRAPDGSYWLIGRFTHLVRACEEMGIDVPTILITEWGWTYNRAPLWSVAREHILQVGELYSQYPQIKAAHIWALNGGDAWGGIGDTVSTYVSPLLSLTLETEFSDPVPPTQPPIGDSLESHIWNFGMGLRTVSLNADAALQKKMLADSGNAGNFGPTGSERWTTYDGVQYAVQPAGSWAGDGERVYYARVPEWNNVRYLTGPHSSPQYPRPSVVYRPSDSTVITNPFLAPSAHFACGHEGVDTSVALGLPFYAVNDGVVVHASDRRWSSNLPSAYGWHVVIRHSRGVHSIYAHARHPLPVSVGQQVSAGQIIARSGNTGNSTGPHLHFSMTVPEEVGCHPRTTFGYYIDPTYVLGYPAPAPTGGNTVDMRAYFFPASGGFGDIITLTNNWGEGPERCQLQSQGNDSFLVKNQQFEHRRLSGDDPILFLKDTSPGEGQFYTIVSPTGWIPRHWRPGDTFTRQEQVTFKRKDNCAVVASYSSTSIIRFTRLHQSWTSDSGVILANVVEIDWLVNGNVDETYFYAPGLGLVAWRKYTGQRSWISERIPVGSQHNNVMETINC